MKIVVAPDSFKGTLGSHEVGEIVADALRASLEAAEIVVIPMADGGEGTTDAVVRATGGERRTVQVTGPLGDPVDAEYGLLPGGRTAVMEMAAAAGIDLVPRDALDPIQTTTFGVGELIRSALGAGVQEIILGAGGSSTVDGGAGMAQALGYELCTPDGSECRRGGGALATISTIHAASVPTELTRCLIRVACDVTNPLLGPTGAARLFGPQKGATPAMVVRLEQGLRHLADLWRACGLLDTVDRPGDGAAGGLAAGLRAFCRAELVPGAELVAELTGFDDEIRSADVLITGEGRTDAQTAHGKLCAVLAGKARAAGARTILISGSLGRDLGQTALLFDEVHATSGGDEPTDSVLAQARPNLERTARVVANRLADDCVEPEYS